MPYNRFEHDPEFTNILKIENDPTMFGELNFFRQAGPKVR
jgi:hypothetical protein